MNLRPQKTKLAVAAVATGLALSTAFAVQAGHRDGEHRGHQDIAAFSLAYPNAIDLSAAVNAALKGHSNAKVLKARLSHRSHDGAPHYLVILSEPTGNGDRRQSVAARINAIDGTVTEEETLGFFSRMRRHTKVEDEALGKIKLSVDDAMEVARAEVGQTNGRVLMVRMFESFDVPVYAVTLNGPDHPVTIGVNAESGDAQELRGKRGWHDRDDDDDHDDDYDDDN